jgi:probable HAF family extracellular repeat protein
MKSGRMTCIIALASLAVAIPVSVAAQDKQDRHNMHHHYKLIDTGTFGGPNSYNESFPPESIINLRGAAAGYADTSVPDPFYPNCAVSDCLVVHASVWKRGVLTDLGSLPGGYSSFASSINGHGEIAGASENGQIDPLTAYPEVIAALWRNGIVDLGTLGGNQSVGNAINDHGRVVGAALNTIPDPLANDFSLLFLFVPAATQAHAFRWTKAEGIQDLGTLGGPDSTAAFVNQRGQIAGQSYTNAIINQTTGYPTLDPFFWENGKMVDIGTLGGTFGYPNWMNSRGQVAGVSDTAGDQSAHAFLWDRHNNPPLTDLGDLGGGYSYANWINDAGEIVGVSSTTPTAEDAFLWKNGVMTDLGNVAGDACNEALSINSQGQIVGFGAADCFNEDHAFLSENGSPLIDLQSLVSPGSGVTLIQAIFINDRGEIAARGKLSNGEEHALLLFPCDEHHPGIDGCDYRLVDAAAVPQSAAPRYVPSGTQALPHTRGRSRHIPN